MADIRGISLKAIKEFVGMEGPACQGNVYVGNKKVAFWSQDGNGGPDQIEMVKGYSQKKLEGYMSEYVSKEFREMGMTIDAFMSQLLRLHNNEKDFKDVSKKGSKSLFVITDGFTVIWYSYPRKITDSAEVLYKRVKDEVLPEFRKNARIRYDLYTDISDFSIGDAIKATDIQN